MVNCFRETSVQYKIHVHVEFNFPLTVSLLIIRALKTASNLKLDNLKHFKYTTRAIAFLAIKKVFSTYAIMHTVLHSGFYTKRF